MRNGIYRVWYEGPGAHGAATTLFVDGRLIACDESHTYLGHYRNGPGWFSGEIHCKRHTLLPPAPEIPNVDEFHMILKGVATSEAASVRCTVVENPSVEMAVRYVWFCEI